MSVTFSPAHSSCDPVGVTRTLLAPFKQLNRATLYVSTASDTVTAGSSSSWNTISWGNWMH
ncbi:MAG: hypothetical protein KDE56_25975 [Anaerolineales bacterium]|nr:hypothetical protein [Anaerolineales bacterium]